MPTPDGEFGLVKSFDIDNGQLDELRCKDCFVLGYELASVDYELKTGEEIQRPVHSENRSRIEKSCDDAGRRYMLTWSAEDLSEGWLWLSVAASEPLTTIGE